MRGPTKFDSVSIVCRRLGNHLDILPDLVAALIRKNDEVTGDRFNVNNVELLLVVNGELKAELPPSCEQVTLGDFLKWSASDLRHYDGTIIAFSALHLALPTLVTSGPRHRSMREVFRQLGQSSSLAKTEQALADFLFNILFESGTLDEHPPQVAPAEWLDDAAKLFILSLPQLLQRLDDVRGLVAVIPDQNLQRYLVEGLCTLVYVTGNEDGDGNSFRAVGSELDWTNIATSNQLCATFEEMSALYPRLDPTQHGFVDLRKVIRRVPAQIHGQSDDSAPRSRYADEIASTIERLAEVCRKHLNTPGVSNRQLAVAAMTLEAEHWVAGIPLDGLVATAFVNRPLCESSKKKWPRAYYLTVPHGMNDHGLGSLEHLLNEPLPSISERDSDPSEYVVALRALRRAMGAGSTWRWVPLHDILFRLDRPDLLAKSAFLVSRTMSQRKAWPDVRGQETMSKNEFRELEMISNLAAVACHTYGLVDPQRWRHGNYERIFSLAHENLDYCVNKLEEYAEKQWKSYYKCLRAWWDRSNTQIVERKGLAQSTLKNLTSAFSGEPQPSQRGRTFRKVQKMQRMFAALLAMTTEAWDPSVIREQLLQVGFNELASFGVTRPKEIFNPNRDPLLPSPLFLAELQRFLALAQTSQEVRISKLPLHIKQEQLEEQARLMAQRVGVDFDQYRCSAEKYAIAFLGQSSLLFVPWHERLWLDMIYNARLYEYKRVINEWYSQPVEISAAKPDPVPPKVYTTLELSLAATPGHSLDGVTVTLRPPDRPIYRIIDDDPVHILTSDARAQTVAFNVVFNTDQHSIPLQLTYEIGEEPNKVHYNDQYWVTVAGRDMKMSPLSNPYIFGDVIANPDQYYGRQHELEELLDQYKPRLDGRPTQRRQAFHVHGMRRAGKTSLLNILRGAIEEGQMNVAIRKHYGISTELGEVLDRIHPVYYDMQELAMSASGRFDFGAFAYRLLELICISVRMPLASTERLLAQLKSSIQRHLAIPSSLQACLEQVLAAIPTNEYLFIVLDELDTLRKEHDGHTAGYLRILIGANLPRTVWVVVTTYGLPADWGSPIQNLFEFIQLASLSKDEATRLILDPARKARIYFTPSGVERIMVETGRHPYLLQVVCHYVAQQLIREHNTFADYALVESITTNIHNLSGELNLHFEEIWRRLSGRSKLVLTRLATLAPVLEGIGQERLENDFLHLVTTYSSAVTESGAREMCRDAIREMYKEGIVTKNSPIQFLIPVFGRWVSSMDFDMRDYEAMLEIDIMRERALSSQEENHAQE